MTDRRGGRIAPDGRPPQAKGVGKNAKRHDLERPATPGLHDSSLQQGDVQAMEQGQRMAPIKQQQQGRSPEPARGGQRQGGGAQGVEVPDAIDFFGGRSSGPVSQPQPRRNLANSNALTWLPVLRKLASGPGASSALVNAFINQARNLRQAGSGPATFVDLQAVDDGIEAMLEEGV